MTTIPPTGSTTSNQDTTSNSTTSTDGSTLDYDDFLQLMVAQLQNQDPLNPTDSTEYMSQIAQFSSVEQGINTNAKLDQLLVNSNISQASTMVGHTLVSADGSASGIIASVKIDSSGTTAILDDGTQIPITAGVTLGY
ncbi:flagellar hook assembly protein FlgD [Hyphomicrobium sp.]|jgi:flagellar basal-body rod modification protein FlgD|uniref:flagellar hook assembly protein FlgD n=1 Tax=Hyphomicrobium sp. TaxID=82 RepID=UPI002CB92DDD|nr:flagellar hook assembly protein FlgD [Hyphomicrobium sp.]HVZ04401.1 flagellar hook assembly protein FlgD [Hyphomicrobium sp.]